MCLVKSLVAKVATTTSEFEKARVDGPNGSYFCLKWKGAAARVETVTRVEAFMPCEDVVLVGEEHAPFLVVLPYQERQD